MQANATCAAALAILATDQRTNDQHTQTSHTALLERSLRIIRFILTSHHVGGGQATDGKTWGNSWISALTLERLMHAIDALGNLLPEREQVLLQKVLLSESDWLLHHYTIVAGLVENNKPESNLWNGCLLHRTALMYPDAPRSAEYQAKGTQFLLNGLSTPADAEDNRRVAGRPLSDWHVGANLFESMACNHHGYLNIGYMVIPLSNIAMLYFSCRINGWEVPEALEHNAAKLWNLVKACTFSDGRLWRIGGDSRARYCYCQDYGIPTWLWAQDSLQDHEASTFENGWLQQLETETAHNADGSFLSARLHELKSVSPLYYARLEGDRACAISMGAYWHRWLDAQPNPGKDEVIEPPTPILEWSDAYHGSALLRSPNRLASWTWRAAQPPQGHCLPPESSDLAEWRGNLGGLVKGLGVVNAVQCSFEQMEQFSNGFATSGSYTVETSQFIEEGRTPETVARVEIASVALPDDQTVIVLQRARTIGRTCLREVKGLFLQIPNDLYNGMQRTYTHDGGSLKLVSCPGLEATHPIPGDWLSINDKLSVVRAYGPPLSIYRPATRQITIRTDAKQPHTERAGGSLYVDEICSSCQSDNVTHEADTELFDLGCVILANSDAVTTAQKVEANFAKKITLTHPDARGLQITGADSNEYVCIVNFSEKTITETCPYHSSNNRKILAGKSTTDSPVTTELTIPAGQVCVVRL